MQNLLHQPQSWGDDWLRRLTETSTQKELFQETSAMAEIVQDLMKQQQQQDGLAQQQPRRPAALAPAGMMAPPQLSSTPLPPPAAAVAAPETPAAAAAAAPASAAGPAADSMDSIWSMLNKPAASKPAPAPVGKAPPSHRSTQLENLFNILQRFNSSVAQAKPSEAALSQPTATIQAAPASPQAWARGLPATGAAAVSLEPHADQGAPPLELELQADSIEPLMIPGEDESSRAKYAEQCRANRAERMRKRKERSEATPDGEEDEPLDPSMQKKVARMMRNRQSAQRSREKRQNYTDKLEAEVAQLKEEKAALANKVEAMENAAGQAPPTPALTEEQVSLLEELRKQVREFQRRESNLQIPALKPLRRHHTMPQ